METITADEPVRCPTKAIGALIEPALAKLTSGGTLTLRVPSEIVGVRDAVGLEQTVRFHVLHARDAANLNDVLVIGWEPRGTQLTPEFHGILSYDADVDASSSLLTLSGTYTPPGGAIGEAFDAALGFWIARATVHDLLRRIARQIEALFTGSAVPS